MLLTRPTSTRESTNQQRQPTAPTNSANQHQIITPQPPQAQAQALVTRHGVNPQVESVMRQLWLTLVPRTGILEPEYYKK